MTPPRCPAQPLIDLLRQLSAVLEALGDEDYRAEPADGMSGSIGAQVRHCVDHVAALAGAAGSGRLSYDRRARGTAVERDRVIALATMRDLEARLEAIPAEELQRRVEITMLLTPFDSLTTESTFGRELAFVLSHTTHHHAVIAWMLRELGASAPEGFGLAPATAAHRMTAEPTAHG